MTLLIYILVAVAMLIVSSAILLYLAKKDGALYDSDDVAIYIIVLLFLSAAWIVSIPVLLLDGVICLVSKKITDWLNK